MTIALVRSTRFAVSAATQSQVTSRKSQVSGSFRRKLHVTSRRLRVWVPCSAGRVRGADSGSPSVAEATSPPRVENPEAVTPPRLSTSQTARRPGGVDMAEPCTLPPPDSPNRQPGTVSRPHAAASNPDAVRQPSWRLNDPRRDKHPRPPEGRHERPPEGQTSHARESAGPEGPAPSVSRFR
jgi:hypothetical protein